MSSTFNDNATNPFIGTDVSVELGATISFDEDCVPDISGNSHVLNGATIRGGTIQDSTIGEGVLITEGFIRGKEVTLQDGILVCREMNKAGLSATSVLVNRGPGTQVSYTQSGGSNNTMFTAQTMTFNGTE